MSWWWYWWWYNDDDDDISSYELVMILVVVPVERRTSQRGGGRLNSRQTSCCFRIILHSITQPSTIVEPNKYMLLVWIISLNNQVLQKLGALWLWVSAVTDGWLNPKINVLANQLIVSQFLCFEMNTRAKLLCDPTWAVEFWPNRSNCLFLHNFAFNHRPCASLRIIRIHGGPSGRILPACLWGE